MGVVGIYLHIWALCINKGIVRMGAKSSMIWEGNLPWKADILSSGLLFPGRTSRRKSLFCYNKFSACPKPSFYPYT